MNTSRSTVTTGRNHGTAHSVLKIRFWPYANSVRVVCHDSNVYRDKPDLKGVEKCDEFWD